MYTLGWLKRFAYLHHDRNSLTDMRYALYVAYEDDMYSVREAMLRVLLELVHEYHRYSYEEQVLLELRSSVKATMLKNANHHCRELASYQIWHIW